MNTVILLRHGKTAATESHLYCGQSDLPLSALGIADLETLRRKYTYPSPDGLPCYTSGMLRTEQTLQTLYGDLPHCVMPEFREMHFGSFELHTYEQLKERTDYQTWISGCNEENICPGGESGAKMTARVLSAFSYLRAKVPSFLLVTHGGPIAAIMAALFPSEPKTRFDWQPAPGHGYRIIFGETTTYETIPK